MIFEKEALMSLKGNFIVGVLSALKFTMKDCVRVKKAVADGIYDESYDMNQDGVLDQTDIDLVTDKAMKDLFG